MKKITFLLLMLFSISTFAQVEVVENFDNAPDFDVPIGWSQTGFFIVSPSFACGGTGKSVLVGFEEFQLPGEATLTTPNYSGITNATDLTIGFTLNIFEQGPAFIFPQTFNAPIASWGSVILEYSLDGGTNWTTAITIDDSNYTYVDNETCVTIPATNFGSLTAGNDFQARFVFNANNVTVGSGNVIVAIVDNVSITQVATTIPNCDVPLISPTDGSSNTDLDDTITWQAATGIPTGYTVSIGTTSSGTDILNSATTSATSYSLSGLGLAYATEYFVNIVPFNSFGDATGCTEQNFTTRLEPIQGATCSNPFEITSFPYIQANQDTGSFENNINEGPCGGFSGAYIDGYDVFYTITPVTDISIDITLASVSNYGAAIHIMDACPDVATNCIALLGHDYSTDPPYNLELNDVVLLAGNTYFIVISSGGFDSTFTYSLIITQNSCINPSMTLTPVSNCATDEFTVDVDVTNLGSATSLTLSDNFGNSDSGITATGIVSFGPYTSTSTVEFTLTNNEDGSCSFSKSTFFYCPPSNDDCTNSIALAINTDDTCTLVTSATNAGATEESATNPINCDFTGNNDIWFSFVASQETLILEYLNIVAVIGEGGTLQATELLEGNCGTFTSLGCFTGSYITLNNLTVNNTYYIRNSSNNGDYAQTFDICLKEAPAPPVNDECSGAIALTVSTDETCDNLLSGSTEGGTPSTENTCNDIFSAGWKDVWYVFTAVETGLYKFSFNTTNFNVGSGYFIYSGSCGALIEESANCFSTNPQVHSMNSGESHYIMVRSGDNGPGIDFDLCVFKLPPPVSNDDCSTPTVLLESIDENGNNMISGNFANSYPSSEACDIGGNTIWYSFTPNYTGEYNFNLIAGIGFPYYSVFNTDDCSQTTDNYVSGFSCYSNGPITTDLVAGTTYLISVYSFDTFSNSETFDLLVYPDAALSVNSNTFESFKYYPNPVINALTIEAKNTISNVRVYNIVGQQIQLLTPNSLSSTINMDDLNKGVYFVTVSIDGAEQTFKVIKK